MFRDAAGYPFRGERPGRRVAGSLVLVASLLVLVTVPVYAGYLVRVLRTSAYGDPAPPRLGDVGGMFVEGLSATGLAVTYAALPLAPFVAVTLPFVDVGLGRAGVAALALVAAVLAVVVPAALASYAVAANVVGGLAVRRVGGVLAAPAYLARGVPAAVLGAVPFAAVWLLGGFGLVPAVVVGAPLVWYGTVVGARLVGTAFGAAADLPRRPVVR